MFGRVKLVREKPHEQKEQKRDNLMSLAKLALLETAGTTLFLFVASAVAFLTYTSLEKGLAQGFILYALFAAFKSRKTGGYNPVITVALWVCKAINYLQMFAFLIGQMIGTVLAGALLLAFFNNESSSLGTPVISGGFDVTKAFFAETLFSMVIVLFSLIRAKHPEDGLEPFAMFVAIPVSIFDKFTGSCFNIFRYIAPAMFTSFTSDWWVYMVSSPVGAVFAVLAYGLYNINTKKHTPSCHKRHSPLSGRQ